MEFRLCILSVCEVKYICITLILYEINMHVCHGKKESSSGWLHGQLSKELYTNPLEHTAMIFFYSVFLKDCPFEIDINLIYALCKWAG